MISDTFRRLGPALSNGVAVSARPLFSACAAAPRRATMTQDACLRPAAGPLVRHALHPSAHTHGWTQDNVVPLLKDTITDSTSEMLNEGPASLTGRCSLRSESCTAWLFSVCLNGRHLEGADVFTTMTAPPPLRAAPFPRLLRLRDYLANALDRQITGRCKHASAGVNCSGATLAHMCRGTDPRLRHLRCPPTSVVLVVPRPAHCVAGAGSGSGSCANTGTSHLAQVLSPPQHV